MISSPGLVDRDSNRSARACELRAVSPHDTSDERKANFAAKLAVVLRLVFEGARGRVCGHPPPIHPPPISMSQVGQIQYRLAERRARVDLLAEGDELDAEGPEE